MSQWVLHRDPRFFDEPEAFRPERWAEGLARRIHRYAYFPFGGGPRICIGNGFAQMEAVLLLATIARRFKLTLVPGSVVRPFPTMTLRPDGGVKVTLARRAT
jgi:cytochrome P450